MVERKTSLGHVWFQSDLHCPLRVPDARHEQYVGRFGHINHIYHWFTHVDAFFQGWEKLWEMAQGD